MVKTIYRVAVIICKKQSRVKTAGGCALSLPSDPRGCLLSFNVFARRGIQFRIHTPRFRYRAKSSHSR